MRVLSSMFTSRFIEKKSRRHLSGKRKVSPLTLKIWSINIIAIFVILIAVLHLDRYEETLIQSELEALEHQAELLQMPLVRLPSRITLEFTPTFRALLSRML